ncbi:UDP-glucose 4-epimerase, partial [Operophtera brumata]
MPRFKTILVTGGAGYIGSHCVVDLVEAGHDVIAVDNFANAVEDEEGSPALQRAERITGKKIAFYKADLLNKTEINDIFDKHQVDCVIHFAALKAVGESMQQPLLYYQNNLLGMLNLLEVVYGEPEYLPITETHKTGNITNVYGRTKYFIEEMLKDLSAADKKWNIISLRYFNPVGAHPSGLIGEDPTKEFTNLMPYMAQVALGKKPVLTVFGSDYNTPDGTGRGVSVKQLVEVFEKVTNTKIPLKYEERRLGDITAMWADATLAKEQLGWTT